MLKSLLILVVFYLPVAAQVRVVESLPNDQFIVEINGREYRALNGAKVAELAKAKIDLDTVTKINAELEGQLKTLALERDLASTRADLEKQKAASFEADFERAKGDAARWQGLFMGERELRQEASQFIPRGSTPKGFMGKVLTFLDSPYSQAFWKLAVPTWQMVRCQ